MDEDCSEVGGYHFEYNGRKLDDPLFSHDEGATSGVSFSFPTEYLLEHGPAHLRALALEIARELPFSFGYASLAFVPQRGCWYAARHELLGLLGRYYGLDLYHLSDTSRRIGTGPRGAYWLTPWRANACCSPSASGPMPSTPPRSSTCSPTAPWHAC